MIPSLLQAVVFTSPRVFDKVLEAHTEYRDLGMPLVTDGVIFIKGIKGPCYSLL